MKVKFVPAQGKATTITESGPSGAPKTRRKGSKGDFDVARDGRRLLVFVKNLAPAARVVVTTKGPPKLDKLATKPPFLDEEAELELELEQTDGAGVATQTKLSNLELKVSDTKAEVRRLNALSTGRTIAARRARCAEAQEAAGEARAAASGSGEGWSAARRPRSVDRGG